MEFPEEEIRNSLIAANFGRACQLAKEWLEAAPLELRNTRQHKIAEESYVYGRFFFHRQERINQTPGSADKARLYLKFLDELIEIRKERELSETIENSIWPDVYKMIHMHVAEGFARAFAGQKSYNLDQTEVIQLAVSLIEINNWPGAKESLLFMYKMNPKNALYNFLLSHVYYQLGEMDLFLTHLREALFIKPEVIEEYEKYLPEGAFQKIWDHLSGEDFSKIARYRYFALYLEINGSYKIKREISDKELEKTEEDFEKLYLQFKDSKNKPFLEDLKPRVLHLLAWLMYYAEEKKKLDSLERYSSIMKKIDQDVYANFLESNK
ncbi:MAG: hypothetical protein OEZ13_06060 [Spirochaetia bacterium]|nr:hypothetical protein [Spirochaetia bacterium]